jgi:hypothetical protein
MEGVAEDAQDASIEFGMKYDAEDEDIIAFRDAFLNNTAIALFVSDGLGNTASMRTG